ncbi:MAG: hypothetical protein KatS3mg060_0792 [Dehalococcoidia bacterium]|nr:MAG: hypothetical protein KatS3mg060_0792 [Dehalococcoidia bacterium]
MAARWRPVGGAVLTALLVVACVATFVTALLNEAPARELELPAGAGPNRLIIRAEVLGVDVNRSEMTVRLSFEPHGDLVAADGRSLTRTLFLVVNRREWPRPSGRWWRGGRRTQPNW